MKSALHKFAARVRWMAATPIHAREVRPRHRLLLADGRVVRVDAVHWTPYDVELHGRHDDGRVYAIVLQHYSVLRLAPNPAPALLDRPIAKLDPTKRWKFTVHRNTEGSDAA